MSGWSARACWSAPILLTLSLCGANSAYAQNGERTADEVEHSNQQRAEALYKEGALLLGAGRYWEAEARFQESLKLLRGRGTLLNLAICHENLGRLASAWRELKSLEQESAAAGDTARVEVAREHLAWIEPQLSYLSVSVAPEAQVAGFQVALDGEPVSAFGVMFPVDPGRHQLRASAPHKKDWSAELSFQTGNQPQSVTIPSLDDAEVVLIAPPPQIPSQAAVPLLHPLPESPPKADYSGVYIAGAATVTLTAGAVVSAILYYDRRAAYHDAISDPDSFSSEEQSARRASAEKMAWINGTLIVSASIGAAVTGFLWYRAAHASKARIADRAWLGPLVVSSGAGLQTGASF